jgi:restriction endonuclease Mrr
MTPSKFEEWCKIILEDMGYKNLNNVTELFEGGVNLSSIEKSQCTYISTRLYKLKDNKKDNVNDNYETIGRPELQKFVGALVQDKVKKGIIITTGDFTSDAKEYLKSLPSEYSITLIDGIQLTKRLRNLRQKEIAVRLGTAS